MEQFRQIGEVLGSIRALMVLQDDIQINRRQCCLLFDMFNLAFDILSEEIKQHLKLEEKNMKWKPLEQPLKELQRIFKEWEMYVRQCLDSKDWLVKALSFHNNRDCVEFHIQNLLCSFPIAIEAIETAGEISGLDLEEMKKKRMILANKYDQTWNDPKLFQWKYGKQYLVSQEICYRLRTAWKEDQWLLLEMIKEKKTSMLSKQEQRLCDLLLKKITGAKLLYPSSILTGAKDYQLRRRLVWGSQYKEMQWLGESFALRHFFGEPALLKTEISALFSLSHPNVVQYLCGFHDEEKNEYFLVMELMSKDLSSYIKEVCGPKRQVPFSLPAAVDIMLQIARGMEYLHSRKIYHGDLNPSNVVLKRRSSSSVEGYFLAKVLGFGLRDVKTIFRTSSPKFDETFTNIWYAPEVLAEQEKPGSSCRHKYSEKADVYSFGILCFELLTGKVPFEDGHLQGDMMGRNIIAGERPLFPFVLPKCLATVIKRCWQTDPNQRPSFSSICRIIRYIKRWIAMNPHLAQPEISSIGHVDFCDIEAGFIKKFPAEAAVDLTPVSQIPFQLFSYRLAEKVTLNRGNNRDQGSDSSSEEVPSSHVDDTIKVLSGSFPPLKDTGSVCSEILDKRILVSRRANNISTDEQFLPTRDTMSVCLETPEKVVPLLRRSNSTTVGRLYPLLKACTETNPQKKSPLLKKYSMLPKACSETNPQKKSPLMKKVNTNPSFRHVSDTKSACRETPLKKAPDKKISLFPRSHSVKVPNNPGRQKWPRKGPPMSATQGQSTRTNAEMHQPMPRKPF
ncbi:hypothetical protein Cgig2_001759 [Carnegiea gigantea]|uniref:Protein kinase domain-containing protein n=1 Tax=Carnegiea gigantea TaxID=171969 RepID=A0A9Q1KAJ9_9CARY|nr:hypothetical protein Cgig2_001759 [Carnegiea gigantea]